MFDSKSIQKNGIYKLPSEQIFGKVVLRNEKKLNPKCPIYDSQLIQNFCKT